MGHLMWYGFDSGLRLMGGRWGLVWLGILRKRLRHMNVVVRSKTFRPACKLDQRNGRAVSGLWQAPVRNSADGRLIDTSLFSQLALTEPLRFQ